MSINVHHISKLYGTQKALNDVSLTIEPGEVVGLLGPNGAGKSTLMKILTCYLPPSQGTASVCGFDILDQSMEVRKRVGYLPENNPLYLDLYVKEFLHFITGINHGVGLTSKQADKRVAEIIELTGLQDEQHKKIGALSRGYRQRVGLAQALLHDPEVLILDEPTSGLDPNQLVDIRRLIRDIGKEKTIMMSTHIMQEVESICDRTIIIHKGVIVADDKTKNLRKFQGSSLIIKVEFDQPVSYEKIMQINGIKAAHGQEELKRGGKAEKRTAAVWLLESGTDVDIRPTVFQFAVESGLTVLSLQREEQRLEEVFQELTK